MSVKLSSEDPSTKGVHHVRVHCDSNGCTCGNSYNLGHFEDIEDQNGTVKAFFPSVEMTYYVLTPADLAELAQHAADLNGAPPLLTLVTKDDK